MRRMMSWFGRGRRLRGRCGRGRRLCGRRRRGRRFGGGRLCGGRLCGRRLRGGRIRGRRLGGCDDNGVLLTHDGLKFRGSAFEEPRLDSRFVMMMRAVFPDELTVFRSILMALSPWATTPRVSSVFAAFAPIAMAMMRGVTEFKTAAVVMTLFELVDGGAVEQGGGVGGNLRLGDIPVKSRIVVTVVAPNNRSAGVVGVIGIVFTPG